jgi:RNA polymerase-binding transcription factor DksA
MAAQKPVKEADTSSKGLGSSKKKTTAKNGVNSKKTAGAKGVSVPVAKQKPSKSDTIETKSAKGPLKKAVSKHTKPTTIPSIIKKVAKTVEKKLKEPVKKTSEADKKETKAVTSKKEVMPEKKSKAEGSIEKEPKVGSSKAAKGETDETKSVVIPKTSTDKKVDYEPDFLKSVLDSPATAPQGPTMRYSDSELQEFRDLIGKKLDAAKKELAYLQGLITRRDEMGGDETDNRYMTMEDGGMSMEREQLSQMASRQITFIDHLEKAIMRIENKTYGICRVTGKLIDKARLRAVPHATLSMEAKLGITK